MKILVTGGTNGMGKGVVMQLAAMDGNEHEVIILSRSKALCETVTQEIRAKSANPSISFVVCDLTRLEDVKRAVEEIRAAHDHLDGIFVNAGLGYAAGREETADGLDPHFQVNYLSHFMLVLELWELLKRSSAGARVVFNVTEGGVIHWDDLQMEKKWGYERGIRQAMVAKRLFYTRLHALCAAEEACEVAVYGFQIPKTVWSNQVTIIPFFMRFMAGLVKLFGGFISIERCGEIMAPLFTEPKGASLEKSGKCITWKKNDWKELKESDEVKGADLQKRLWDLSMELLSDHMAPFNI